MEKFFDKSFTTDKSLMYARFRHVCRGYGWQSLVTQLLQMKDKFEGLRVAEVGCGTGTFSLTLALLGADITLIDADEDALSAAKKSYGLYDLNPNYITGSVVDPVPDSLKGQFDVVISVGLAEHFIGEERERCIQFHKDLLREDGIVYIGVPNRVCLMYWLVRWFRTVTKTWHIDLEVPFTNDELRRLASTVSLTDAHVVGNHSTIHDIYIYGLGFISAVLDCLPSSIRNNVRASTLKKQIKENDDAPDAKGMIASCVEKLKNRPSSKGLLKDHLSSGLILLAHRKSV